MSKIVYRVLRHDGGWAYQANGTFSETHRTHDEARAAARQAAAEQSASGESAAIEYEDEQGRWHQEMAKGDDRPETSVEG